MEFALGSAFGFVCFFVMRMLKKRIREKNGVRFREYRDLPFNIKLKDTIRHIVFEYNIKRVNNDFLLNIDFNGTPLMQIMHRSHFPELCKSESDISFGIALYIPVKNMDFKQIESLSFVLEEESEIINNIDKNSRLYFIVDLGSRVRFSGYLLTRIIKEVLLKKKRI